MRSERIISVLVFLLLLGHLAAAGAERSPVPTAEAQTAAEKVIRDVFKEDYARAKKIPAAKATLAEKLFKEGEKTKDDSTARFTLFREARDLAAAGGDITLALQVVDLMVADFNVNGSTMKGEVFDKVSPITVNDAKSVAEMGVIAIDEVLEADSLDAATRIVKASLTAARKINNAALIGVLQKRAKEIDDLKMIYGKVQAAQKVLETTPTDDEANLTVGKYVCFVNGAWEKGLPFLVKGSDTKLKALAEKEIAAPTKTADQVEVADGWAEVSTKENLKTQLQLHALHWYRLALADTTGLTKTRVEKRIGELETAVAAANLRSRFFTHIHRAIAEKNVRQWPTSGGLSGKDKYEEVPPEGAILIGFRYTVNRGGEYTGVIQPIFMTARGEVGGKTYGILDKNVKVMEARAKPGYAVGAITTRNGGYEGLKPTFMRITDKGLNINDKYDGPQIGSTTAPEKTLGDDGQFIIGIYGVTTETGRVDTIAPVSLVPVIKKAP